MATISIGKRKRANEPTREADSDSELSSLGEVSDVEDMFEIEASQTSNKKTAGRRPGAKKPAQKRTKANGDIPTTAKASFGLPAIRRKGAKKRKPRESAFAAGDNTLYALVFAGGVTLDHICAEWISRFRADEAAEMASLFTFVLRAAGCEYTIDTDAVQDPDHFAEKLTDIQEEYQSSEITDYPLARKAAASFKQTLQDFFNILIRSSAVNLLFEQLAFMDNLHGWVGTMTSAGNRPFRHTSTVISLSIITALCDVGKDILTRVSATNRQLSGEKRKARPNAGRVGQFETKLAELDSQIETLNTMVTTWFDTVFLHRYRDVDPRIRVDCVQALSTWIVTYPDIFFDGQYLRYLGWLLSDTQATTRLEVVRQLRLLFSDPEKIAGLSTFTERFHSRIVEMATRDADAAVRSAAIELLGTLREAGLLEPDDIDTVGALMFDSERRVRKSVVPFFALTVSDLYESKVEDLGGADVLEEAVDEAVRAFDTSADENEQPQAEWLKVKCVADLLTKYDATEGPQPSAFEKSNGTLFLHATPTESRFSVAARAMCEHDPSLAELLDWQRIAAYLLVDHSSSSQEDAMESGSAEQFRAFCRLSDKQYVILLEILHASLRHSIAVSVDAGAHKSRLQTEESVAEQEETAKRLAYFLPRLLSKFGDQAATASAVLRLQPALNLQIFQALRQESTVLADLLDDINKQFMTHGSESVLTDASQALLHAKSFDDLDEIAESRVQSLWDDTLDSLHTIVRTRKDACARGKLGVSVLSALSSTVLRLSKLAKIADCIDVLDASPKAPAKDRGQQEKSEFTDSLSCVALLLLRAVPQSSRLSGELAAMEDSIAVNACSIITFYFLWQIKKIATTLASGTSRSVSSQLVDSLLTRRNESFEMMTKLLLDRRTSVDVKSACSAAIFEIATAFATLRRFNDDLRANVADGDVLEDGFGSGDWTKLITDVSVTVQEAAIRLLGGFELALAQRLGHPIEQSELEIETEVGVDADPESDNEDEPESDSEDSGDRHARTGQSSELAKMHKQLVAEQRLCEYAGTLVLACEAKVVDSQLRARLELNKTRLGSNYRELVDFFSRSNGAPRRKKERASSTPAAAKKARVTTSKKAKSKSIVVSDDEDDGDDELDDEIEDEIEDDDVAEPEPEEDMDDIEDSQTNPVMADLDLEMSAPTPGAGLMDDDSDLSSLADED